MNCKTLEGASMADNPCWGGPEPHLHDLQYLLRVLGGEEVAESNSRTSSNDADMTSWGAVTASSYSALIDRVIARLIIHNDDNYIAIRKPADLRMDGPHRATVHKLLLYLYPPPSLVRPERRSDPEEAMAGNCQRGHKRLLESIAPLTNSSDLADDPFRIVHQLDYATSGVLLLGKNRKAAGTACISFQERRAKKKYVAVVMTSANTNNKKAGDLPFGNDFFEDMPTLPRSSLEPWDVGSLERQYRKKRRKDTANDGKKKDTFNGYMPEHAIFAKWRGFIMKSNKATSENGAAESPQNDAKYMKEQKNHHHGIIMSQLIQSTAKHLTSQDIDELLSLGTSWNKVKAHCAVSANHNICNWPSTVERMTKEYNQSTTAVANASGTDQQKKKNDQRDKSINETKHESASLPPLFRIQNEEPDSFYICASIGEVADGRFDVFVDPLAAIPATQSNTPSLLPEMKPSLTKCTVLWRGFVVAGKEQRVPVAKVLLSPWTGRRHQLRVHLSRVAGCPILGDVAYTNGSKDRGVIGSRMCLHAKELSIPLIGGDVQTFSAQDPFLIEGDSIRIDNFC